MHDARGSRVPGGPDPAQAPAASHAASEAASTAASPAAHEPHHARDVRAVVCAVITVSDSRTPETDTSGREIRERLAAAGHIVDSCRIVPDEPAMVRRVIEELVSCGRIDAVVLSGGTGIAPRDTTFEAVTSMLVKRIDGFGELFRMLSFEEIGSAAMLSR